MKKIILSLLFLSFPGFAGLYPVITSLTVTYDSYGAGYNFTQQVIDIGSASEQVVPNGWTAELAHKHTGDGVTYTASLAEGAGYVDSDNSKTVGDLAMEVYNQKGGKNTTYIHHHGPTGYDECIAYILKPSSSVNWSDVKTPGGCLVVPPADEWCKITSPELVLEHGTITLKQSEGSVATDNIGVQCTTDSAVTFNLIDQDKYIYLDQGKSEITVDNKPLNSKINLQAGDSQLPIKDQLTGITTAGFHTGSSVLVMSPY